MSQAVVAAIGDCHLRWKQFQAMGDRPSDGRRLGGNRAPEPPNRDRCRLKDYDDGDDDDDDHTELNVRFARCEDRIGRSWHPSTSCP